MNRVSHRAPDAPLRGWGEALRAARHRRKRLGRRIAGVATGVIIVLGSAAVPPAPRLAWNASASAPVGLYVVFPGGIAAPGDMVIARVPAPWRRLAATRHYIPINVPLVKRVAAAAGDQVCALGHNIFVNSTRVTIRRATDGAGRPMPSWSGCVRLRGRRLFLLTDAPASFDGRYFGVTEGADMIGTAWPLWTR